MARLPQRTSLRVHIQLGSLFSLLCLCTSLLSPSGMTTMAETQELVCLQLRGGVLGLQPLPSSYSQAPKLLQLPLHYVNRMKGKLFPLPLS